jgi:twitching motility two-component system response regulator PilH
LALKAEVTVFEKRGDTKMSKILVVDDSPTELAAMASALQQQGFEVVTARDGDEALLKLALEQPSLLVLDVIMPGKNGFSLCREIRGKAEYRQMPIIMLTSKDQPSDKFWGLKQGANEYLTKPWDPGNLVRTVQGLL